jgi:hypothetical protein
MVRLLPAPHFLFDSPTRSVKSGKVTNKRHDNFHVDTLTARY